MKKTNKDLIYKAKQLTKGLRYKVLVPERQSETFEGNTIIYPKICTTDDYELAVFHEKNRVITHAKKMQDSVMALHKVLRPIVIALYNDKYYILDGQNLYKALVKMGLSVEFYLFEVKTENELVRVMRQMNSSATRWSLDQFVKVNTSTDKKANAHDKLLRYVKDYATSIGMTTKVMASIMYSEDYYNENRASNAIKGDYFVQNVPDIRIKSRLTSLKRFYKVTKMTPSNYLNAGFVEFLYDKKDMFYKNEKEFFECARMYAHKNNLTSYKFGNKKDVWSILTASWKIMTKG
jgi:hypothetical protein